MQQVWEVLSLAKGNMFGWEEGVVPILDSHFFSINLIIWMIITNSVWYAKLFCFSKHVTPSQFQKPSVNSFIFIVFLALLAATSFVSHRQITHKSYTIFSFILKVFSVVKYFRVTELAYFLTSILGAFGSSKTHFPYERLSNLSFNCIWEGAKLL